MFGGLGTSLDGIGDHDDVDDLDDGPVSVPMGRSTVRRAVQRRMFSGLGSNIEQQP